MSKHTNLGNYLLDSLRGPDIICGFLEARGLHDKTSALSN